jgi:hypothetical protein
MPACPLRRSHFCIEWLDRDQSSQLCGAEYCVIGYLTLSVKQAQRVSEKVNWN